MRTKATAKPAPGLQRLAPSVDLAPSVNQTPGGDGNPVMTAATARTRAVGTPDP